MNRATLAKLVGHDFIRRLLPAGLVQSLFFRREQRLYDGTLRIGSDAPSALFFTVHKCASTFAPKALQYFNERRGLGLIAVNLPSYVRKVSGLEPADFMAQHAERLFQPRGMLYAPLRRYVNVPGREHYRTILMLRDPRDVLVSQYYSVAYSHRMPFRSQAQTDFARRRAAVRETAIDDFVLAAAHAVGEVYGEYARHLLGQPGVVLLRYEDMVGDPRGWVFRLAAAIGVACEDADAEYLIAAGQLGRERREDVKRHVRSGATGDHLRKLQPATILALNERLAGVLKPFGYETTSPVAPRWEAS